MSHQNTEIIDLTFLGTDNHRTTHRHLLTFSYQKLKELLYPSTTPELDTPFIDNSQIQIRLFDGIGCQGTKEHPRPGNYTWGKNFNKIEKKTNERISHHLAKITGEGMQALLDEADDYIKDIIKKNNASPKKIINLKGYSRGADACIRLANRIYEKHPQIEINMFLVDPVPGPFHRDDDGSYIIPGNVKRLDVTFMKDEKIRFFKPQHMGRLVIQNPLTTNVTEYYLEGLHGEALYIDKGIPETDQKKASHEKTKKNLIQFIWETTQKEINLPTCYRDRTQPANEQFTADNTILSPPLIKKIEDIDLTQISDKESNTDKNDFNETKHVPSETTKQDNRSAAPPRPQNMSNKDKKSAFHYFKTLFHQTRTLAQENHQEISIKQKSTQDNELNFYKKQFRDVLNFYHYHYPYSKKRRTTFETVSDALIRIKNILFGKSMEDKTKIWPDHYAATLLKEVLKYEPSLKFNIKNKSILEVKIQELEFALSEHMNEIQNKEVNDTCDIYEKFIKLEKIYDEKEQTVLDKISFSDNKSISCNSYNFNKVISNIKEMIEDRKKDLIKEKFKKTIQVIQKLTNSKFFKDNLQTYEEYQNDFVTKVKKISTNPESQNLPTSKDPYKDAQIRLQKLINDAKKPESKSDPNLLHELYAIGQPQYIQLFMLSERKKQHQEKEEQMSKNIDIGLSRRL